MKILILFILLVLIIISSNFLLQKKIEHFYEYILPEYEKEQNNKLLQISENVENIDGTIKDVYGISNNAVLQTDNAVKKVNKIRNDISNKMVNINKRYNKIVAKKLQETKRRIAKRLEETKRRNAKRLQETKRRNANINKNNHRIIFYEHTNYRGRSSTYRIPTRGLRSVNLCPRRRRCYRSNDRWSSVRIPRYTLLEVWKNSFRGRYGRFTGNIPNLHRHRLGDNITSFRVRKTRYDVITPTNGF